ncbi:MAG: hypothetical protein PUB07_00450, partial [Clostridia bacterium]|nr:hypothetical protein [Clostridia bacterium]
MKKIASLLSLIMVLTLLSGCYKQNTDIKVGVGGDVEVTASIFAPKEMYTLAGGTGSADIIAEIEALKEYYGESTKEEIISITQKDVNGNVIEDGAVAPDDGTMVGAEMKVKLPALSDLSNGVYLSRFLVTTPMQQDAEGYGLKIEQKNKLFGTTYTVSGKYSLYGSSSYKAAFDEAEQGMKDKISDASSTISFSFPFGFTKSNADSKGFLGTKLTWTATPEAPDKDVYFTATVINPLVLGLAIAVIVLLILVIILAKKAKQNNEPDAYFVDEEGNQIPIYDAEDTEGDMTEEEDI